jgi:hypothetical protein
MEEFNKRFTDLVKSLPQDIMSSKTAILIYYMEAFEREMKYALRDKDPQTLKDAQVMAVRIDKNMREARKSSIHGFTRGTSSQPYEEKKKNVESQGSSNDGIKELTQLIKQMDINHANQLKEHVNQIKQMEINQANQMNSMQNRLIAMEMRSC